MEPTKKKRVTVYRLIDPRDKEVRYIGATVDVERRRRQHWGGRFSNWLMRQWIRGLRKEGLRPRLEVIEECPIENSSYREEHWITHYVEAGADLLNWDGVRRAYSHSKPGNNIKTLQDS